MDLPYFGSAVPHFEEIEKEIQRRIYHADESIQIAVAYFTNEVLFRALCDAILKGKKVTLVVSEDEVNFRSSISLHDLVAAGAEVYVTLQERGMMHHKFCIIDGHTVLLGSYNWTARAQSNAESICVIEYNDKCVERFSKEFANLIERSNILSRPQNSFKKIKTGLQAIDETFNGLSGGTLTIIVGKSQSDLISLLLSISNNIWLQGDNAGFISLARQEKDIARKLLSINLGIPTEKLTEADLSSLSSATHKLAHNEKTVKALSRPTLHELLQDIKIVFVRGVAVLIIDDISGIDLGGCYTQREDFIQFERVFKELRHLARSANIPIVATLLKEQKTKKADQEVEEIKRSVLYEVCDTLFFLQQKEVFGFQSVDENSYEFHCVKNNTGTTGVIVLEKMITGFSDVMARDIGQSVV